MPHPSKRHRAASVTDKLFEEQLFQKKILLDRSSVLCTLDATTGDVRIPVCTEAYQRWCNFSSSSQYSSSELISILKVASFMHDSSTATLIASMVAAMCRAEFAEMFSSNNASDTSVLPVSKLVLQLSSDLDDATLALVLAKVPLWHLQSAPPSLCSAAVVAHSLDQGRDVKLDKHFVKESTDDKEYDDDANAVDDENQMENVDGAKGEDDPADKAQAAPSPQPRQHFFVSGLKDLPSTTASLSLADNDLCDADLAALADLSANLKSLTHLDICHNDISVEGLCAFLPGFSQLRSLNNMGTSIEPDGYHHLMPMLSPLTSLTALDMSRSNMSTAAAASVLMASLWPLHQLRSLVIEEEYIDDSVLEHIFRAPAFKRLQHFSASQWSTSNPDRSRSMAALAAVAADPAVSLTSLRLPLSCRNSVASMLQTMSRLTCLHSLHIDADPWDDGDEEEPVMLPLGPSLAALPDLRTLRVTLTSSTLASFAGSIGALSSLTSLDISDSVLVSPEDAVHIAQFAKLQMLRVLVFSELLYCDDVGDALRLTLPQLKALEELQMLNLMIETDSDTRLHGCLPSLSNLKKLVMGSYSDAIGSGPVPIWLSDLDLLAPLTQLTHLEVNTLSPQLSGTPIPEVSTQEAEAAYAALSGLTKMEHLELQGFGVSCPTNAESPPVKHTDRFLLNLAGVLDKMPQLSFLGLNECPLSKDEAEAFGAALSRRIELMEVHFQRCDLVDASAQAVSRHLRLLPRLREVTMYRNAIDDTSAIRSIWVSSMATFWDLNGNRKDFR